MYRFLALASLAGCNLWSTPVKYSYSPASSTQRAPAKPNSCSFETLTTSPSRAFEELGVLDYTDGPSPNKIDEFRRIVAPQVCRSGGDAVIAFANGWGHYIKGTVVRYVPEPAAAAATPAATAATPAAAQQ